MKAVNKRLTAQVLDPRGSIAFVSVPQAFFFGLFAA
jgi:hypothetical protein